MCFKSHSVFHSIFLYKGNSYINIKSGNLFYLNILLKESAYKHLKKKKYVTYKGEKFTTVFKY